MLLRVVGSFFCFGLQLLDKRSSVEHVQKTSQCPLYKIPYRHYSRILSQSNDHNTSYSHSAIADYPILKFYNDISLSHKSVSLLRESKAITTTKTDVFKLRLRPSNGSTPQMCTICTLLEADYVIQLVRSIHTQKYSYARHLLDVFCVHVPMNHITRFLRVQRLCPLTSFSV